VSHDHDHSHGSNGERDPEEQQSLARDLGESLTDLFQQFVKGDIKFEEVVFETFHALEDLAVIATGDYEIEYVDETEEHEHSH